MTLSFSPSSVAGMTYSCLRANSKDDKAIKTLELALKDFEAVNVTGHIRTIRDAAENELQIRYFA